MHKAKACVISCIDFRFNEAIQNYLRDHGLLNVSDEISIAGGTRDFVKPIEKADGKYIWKELELSLKLHDPNLVIFMDHQDCGGYAQDGTIPEGLTAAADQDEHRKYFKILKEKFIKLHPDKHVRFYHATLDGKITEVLI